eukprot:3613987-Heterocapsa_arctica.AAC.2
MTASVTALSAWTVKSSGSVRSRSTTAPSRSTAARNVAAMARWPRIRIGPDPQSAGWHMASSRTAPHTSLPPAAAGSWHVCTPLGFREAPRRRSADIVHWALVNWSGGRTGTVDH